MGAGTGRKVAGLLAPLVLILTAGTLVKWSTYDPAPAVWDETSIVRSVTSAGQPARDIDVTVQHGWMADVGERIVADLWVKYGGQVRVEFRCATLVGPAGYLGVGLRSDTRGPVLVGNAAGACP